MVVLLRRWVKPHGPIAAWLRNLFHPGLRPQRTFEQCSPSPVATAATGPCTLRKSQEATIHLYEAGKRASLEGSFEAVLTLTVAQAQVEATR